MSDGGSVELVLAEFGFDRENAGKADLSVHSRLNPTLDSFRERFPDARVTLYTDVDIEADGIDRRTVEPPFDRAHPRYGWRASNYFQAWGMRHSDADVAIAMDADMKIVSPAFRRIVPIATRFGLAVPANPRCLVWINGSKGLDADYDRSVDPTRGNGFAYNHSPMACAPAHERARAFLDAYLRLSVERPGRGTHLLWEAAWESGVHPYLLPFPWCVCTRKHTRSRYLDGSEIALHVGHPDVEPRYREVRRSSRFRDWLSG